jgi:hypothetical protein
MIPLPSICDPDFIATNQGERENNVLKRSKKNAKYYPRYGVFFYAQI